LTQTLPLAFAAAISEADAGLDGDFDLSDEGVVAEFCEAV
jgi:hypothetical protein